MANGLTPAEQAELAQLEAQEKAGKLGPAPSALSSAEQAELAKLEAQYGDSPQMKALKAVPAMAKDAVMQELGNWGQAIDYPMGFARTAVGQGVGLLTGKPVVQAQDWKNALGEKLADAKAPAMMTKDILERAGVGELGSTPDLPLLGRFTGRGTLGFLGDTAIGMGATGGLNALSRATGEPIFEALGAAQQPIRQEMKDRGVGMYRSGLRQVDNAAKEMGKGEHAVSDALGKQKIWGRASTISDKAGDLAHDLEATQRSVLASADRAGVQVDVRAALEPALAEANEAMLSKVKSVSDIGRKVKEKIMAQIDHAENIQRTIGDGGRATMLPSEMSQLKSSLYSEIGDDAWKDAIRTKQGSALAKRFAGTVKEATEQAVNEASPLLGTTLKETNKDLGALYSASKKFATEARKETNKKLFTSVDAMIAGAKEPLMLGVKKGAELFNSPAIRTGGGLLLQTPMAGSAAVQGFTNATKQPEIDPLTQRVLDARRKYGQ